MKSQYKWHLAFTMAGALLGARAASCQEPTTEPQWRTVTIALGKVAKTDKTANFSFESPLDIKIVTEPGKNGLGGTWKGTAEKPAVEFNAVLADKEVPGTTDVKPSVVETADKWAAAQTAGGKYTISKNVEVLVRLPSVRHTTVGKEVSSPAGEVLRRVFSTIQHNDRRLDLDITYNPAEPAGARAAYGMLASFAVGEGLKTNKNGMNIEDLVVGDGAEAVAGKTVTVHYRGTFQDGRVFDESYRRGEPFNFLLGGGQVIKGWDQGVQGMKVGGKRRLTIPPDLAYGARGAGGVIPPNATLVFEVELLGVG